MSRSIHETRKMVRNARREDWGEPALREKHLAALEARLERKGRVKHQIASERQGRKILNAEEQVFVTTDPAAIPIIVEDEGPFVHYPATPDDLRAVMRRLPQGVCDGLTKIVLGLNTHEPEQEYDFGHDLTPDPYTGRLGQETVPGVWARWGGYYLEETATIRLRALVYPPELQNGEIKEYLCRLRFLSSFVFFIAYHHGYVRRSARGRWLQEDEDGIEKFASDLEYEWLHQVVVPYLEHAYPTQTRRLIEWVEQNGGVRLTLDQMAGDPRKCIFDIHHVLFFLAQWIEEEEADERYEFANFLHMCEFYDEALTVIEQLLREEPQDLEVLRLKAHVRIEQGHPAEGRELALKLIEVDPDFADAWGELCYAAEELELWEEVIAAATREFELGKPKINYGALLPRIRARIALGDFAGAEADIALLEQSPSRLRQKRANQYRDRLKQAMAETSQRPRIEENCK